MATLHLLIDTATQGINLGLMRNQNLAWQTYEPAVQRRHGDLASLLETGLRQLHASPHDITHILIGSGPGSFTGIKIGLAFIYGMIRGYPAQNKPLIHSVNSLILITEQLISNQECDAVILPSTKESAYVAWQSPEGITCMNCCFNTNPRGADSLLQQFQNIKLVKPWPALDKYDFHGKSCLIGSPDAFSALLINALKERACQLPIDQWGSSLPQPNYLRASRAEERLLTIHSPHNTEEGVVHEINNAT